jgi:hypothetical protein
LTVAVALSGSTAAAALEASRPIEEMRGGCDHYALDVDTELAAMTSVPRKLTALAGRGPAPAIGPAWQPLTIRLQQADQVALAHTPKRPGPNAGLVALSVPDDGVYRVSVDSAAWIEIVHDDERVEPIQFEMQTGCPTLFKIIRYRLTRGGDYWLELSAGSPVVTMLFTAETR